VKILITGANGMLASNLSVMYREKHTVIATDKTAPTIPGCDNRALDITSTSDAHLIQKLRADVVIHCAALTNVDFCEKNPDLSDKVIAEGSRIITEASAKAGAYCIHISTDAVFDGKTGNYTEESTPSPLMAYGRSKLLAEKLVAPTGALIVRTCIYGWNRENKESLAEWMLHTLERNEPLSAYSDLSFSPILVNNLGDALIELASLKQRGILNVAGSEGCTKLAFAHALARVFGLDERLIRPISSDSVSGRAPRAKNLILDTRKAQSLLKCRLLDVQAGLQKMRELRESGFVDELKRSI
jgi:dTDP-4-dehydrorhamnose reductase